MISPSHFPALRSLKLRSVIHGVIAVLPSLNPLHAEPIKGEAKFSLYYIAEVKPKESGGIQGKVELGDREWEVFRLSPADTRRANMEGSLSVVDDDGEMHLASIISIGRWTMIPKGWEGRGNRTNPLVSYRSVAADPRYHPYGSRLFVPSTVGYTAPDGRKLDGWFWVADAGGGIKGRFRFDVFVGREARYLDHMKAEEGKWTEDVTIEHPPKLPAKFNPKKPAGMTAILETLGYHIDTTLEAMVKSPKEWSDDVALGTALNDFQRQHPEIPFAEYGTRIGAITQWYLHQAGAAVAAKKPYPAKPGGPEIITAENETKEEK